MDVDLDGHLVILVSHASKGQVYPLLVFRTPSLELRMPSKDRQP
jgi:hypothetical protein